MNYRRKIRFSFRRAEFSPITLVALLVLAIFVTKGAFGAYQKYRESEKRLISVEYELEELKQRETELKTEIANLNNEEGIRTAVRSKFGLVKEGEEVIVFTNPAESSSTSVDEKTGRGSLADFFKSLLE